MAITSDILTRLAALNLPTEAFQGVLSILADVQAASEKAEQEAQERRSRNASRMRSARARTVCAHDAHSACTQDAQTTHPPPPPSPSPEKERSPLHPPKEKQTPSLSAPPTISGDRAATRPAGSEERGFPIGERSSRPEADISASSAARPSAVDAAFAEFWREYPKRDGANPKQPAAKKFAAALKSGAEPEAIIAGARRYRAECDEKKLTGTSMVAQALTWLNQQRWGDYAPAAEPKARGDPEPTAEQLAARRRLIEMGGRMLNGGEGNSEPDHSGLVQAGDRSRPAE